MKTSGLYLITNTANGMVYVGSTNDIEKRFYKHRWHLRRGDHPNRYLGAAWKKYGEAAFRFELLEAIEDEAARYDRETIEIAARCATVRRVGYNIAPVAACVIPVGTKFSPERCRQMSEARKGIKHSPERNEKARIAATGRMHSEESKAKMRERALEIWRRPGNEDRRIAARKVAKVSGMKRRGQPWTEKGRALRAASAKPRAGTPRSGFKLSDSHKAAIAESNRRRARVRLESA